jgi:hypothetical protein
MRYAWPLLFVCLACAPNHGVGVSPVTLDTTFEVHIRIEPPPDTLPFDPRGARLLAANRQLTALIGHGVEVRIDVALVADLRNDFERQLIVAVEDLLRALSDFRASNPTAFAHAAAALMRVECRTRVLAEDSRATFEGGTIRIEQPAHATRLVPPGAVREALDTSEDAWLDAHFEHVDPEALSESDEAAYFDWLTRTRPGYGPIWEWRHGPARNADSVDKIADAPHGEVIARIVRLDGWLTSKHSALAISVRAWLFEQIAWLANRYKSDRALLPSIGKGKPMRRGERALCDWLQKELPHANADERLLALDALFREDMPEAFPGIDRFELGIAEANAWIAAGKPSEGGESSQAKLMDRVVCPSVREPDGSRVRSRGCHPDWLLFAIASESNQKKLAAVLDTRDADLTEQLFASLKYSPSPGTIALFRLLDPQRPAFSAALKVLAEVLVDEQQDAIIKEAEALWREQPERRGDVLYILARARRHDRTLSDSTWASFQEQYGESVMERDLEGFLDHGAPAFVLLPPMWPALGKGFSRAKPIADRLGILLPGMGEPAAGEAIRVLSEVVSRLCEDKATADLGALHAALDARANAYPPERATFLTLLHDTAPGGCVARKKSEVTQ